MGGEDPAAAAGDETGPYVCAMDLRYPSSAAAAVAKSSLEVDEELQPHKVKRTMRLEGATLHVRFAAKEAKVLRVSVSTFCDAAALVSRTMLEFDTAHGGAAPARA